MIDLGDVKDKVSYVNRYKQRIAERKQRRLQTEYVSDATETDLTPKNSLSSADLTIQVSEKIDAVCILDKEFQEISSFSDVANRRAESAVKAASDAAVLSAGLFKRKKAIEALQAAQKEQALANESNTQAITRVAMLQEKIIEAIRALFALGVNSIAANRSVYQQLELRMQGASEQELSDLARNEILDVMQQLNERYDMMARQKKLNSEVHKQQARIDDHEKEIALLKADLKKMREEKSARGYDNVLPYQAEKNQSPSDAHKDESEPTKDVTPNKTETDEQKEKNVKQRKWSWSRKR